MRLLSVAAKWIRRGSVPRDILLTILSALAGWGISHFYYVRALEDMKADAEERRRVEELILRGVEAFGNIKYSRDADGKVVGVVIELRGTASAQSGATGSLTSDGK